EGYNDMVVAPADHAGYRSPHLTHLRMERDRRKSSLKHLEGADPIESSDDLHPVMQRVIAALRNHASEHLEEVRSRYLQAREEVDRALWSALEYEAGRLSTHVSRNDDLSVERCLTLERDVLGEVLAATGLILDRRRSTAEHPVFSKELTKGWILAFSCQWGASRLVMKRNRQLVGLFSACLALRSPSLVGPVNFGRRQRNFIQVRYEDSIPGFDIAYRRYRSLSELEVVLRAHASLWGLLSGSWEPALIASLAQASP
ncbi:MAG: hypothetical protein KIS84_14635, partial [Dokdonella sp.]|nr:hypothetical protein [Dokdonella sp.]